MEESLMCDKEILAGFQEECGGHLATLETGIIALEEDPEQIHAVFRSVHSIKGSAGMLGLTGIAKLAHTLETILEQIRSGLYAPNGDIIDLLLEGMDGLKLLLDNMAASNEMDLSSIHDKLDAFLVSQVHPDLQRKIDPPLASFSIPKISKQVASQKKILIVEDEEINQIFLAEAIQALDENIQVVAVDSVAKGLFYLFSDRFDLVFLDIMMPNLDGTQFIKIVEENKKAGLLASKPNIVVQTAIRSLERLLVLAANESVQEIIRKPIALERVQECVYRYCFEDECAEPPA